jgi:hypothetical protein
MRFLVLSGVFAFGAFVACGGGGEEGAAPGPDGTSSSSSSSSGGATSSSGGSSSGGSSSGASTSSSGGETDAGTDGDANVAPPDPRIDTSKPSASGTRLKQRIRKTADGAETFLGWRDTQINQDCAFKTASDGELRCLPTNVAARGAFYIDSGCTQPAVAQQTNACTQAAYASDEDSSTCPARTKLHALGTALANGATYYYQAAPGSPCETRTAGAVGTTIYPLGAEVTATDFVKATVSKKASGVSGLDLQEITADDGAKTFWSFEDTAKMQACGFLRANDSSMRCLPSARANATIGSFWSSGCVNALNLATDGQPASCAAPAFASRLDAGKYTTYAVGAAHVDPIFMKISSSCYDFTPTGLRVYDLGTEQTPTTFLGATETDGATKGVLVEKLLDVGGKVKQTAAFYDKTLSTNVTMSPYSATDGSLRALPEHELAIISTYSATCNGPALIHTYQPGTPKFAQDTLSQNNLCPPRRRIVRVGTPYSGQLYTGGCYLLTKPSEVYATGIRFYKQGTEVLPAEMVALTEELR